MKRILASLLIFSAPLWAQHSVTLTGTQTGTPAQTIIYKNGVAVNTLTPGPSPTITFVDTSVAAGDTPSYYMANADAQGNIGPPSNVVSVVVPGGTTPPPANTYVIRPISALNFAYTMGGAAPATQVMRVSDTSPIDPKYSVTSDSSWLTATAPVTGASDGLGFQVVVKATPGTLAAGNYVGHLTVTMATQTSGKVSYSWSNSPVIVPVNLVIAGNLPVTISCPVAVGGVTNLPSGAYSMTVTSGKVTATCTGTK